MDTRNHLFNSVDSFKEILTSFLQEKSHLHKIEKDILMDKLRALYIEISEHPESARLLTFNDFPIPTSEEELPDVEVEVFEMPEAPLVTTVASETISVPESVQVPEPVVEAEIPAFDFSSQSELQSAKVEEASTVVEDQTPELSPSIEEPTHVEISQPEVTDTIEPEVESSQEPEPIVPTVVPPPIIPSEPLNKLEKLLNDLKDLTGNSEEQKPATDENGDVVFDLNLTKKEERPLSYYAIERKLALEEKGISEEEAAQQSPKVSIVNPFVGKPTQQNVPPAETTRVIPPHLQEQMEKKEETAPQVPAAELNV